MNCRNWSRVNRVQLILRRSPRQQTPPLTRPKCIFFNLKVGTRLKINCYGKAESRDKTRKFLFRSRFNRKSTHSNLNLDEMNRTLVFFQRAKLSFRVKVYSRAFHCHLIDRNIGTAFVKVYKGFSYFRMAKLVDNSELLIVLYEITFHANFPFLSPASLCHYADQISSREAASNVKAISLHYFNSITSFAVTFNDIFSRRECTNFCREGLTSSVGKRGPH